MRNGESPHSWALLEVESVLDRVCVTHGVCYGGGDNRSLIFDILTEIRISKSILRTVSAGMKGNHFPDDDET